MSESGDLALRQGTLDVLVLKALAFGARHGYAVASWIRDTSDGFGSCCVTRRARALWNATSMRSSRFRSRRESTC